MTVAPASGAPLSDRVAVALDGLWPGATLEGFETLPGGHSGVTCLAQIAGGPPDYPRLVVKAAPPGRPPVGRHDVLRQARVLGELARNGSARTPTVYAVSDTAHEPFFLMQWSPGDSIEPVLDSQSSLSAETIRHRCLSAIDALVELHEVPVVSLDLSGEQAQSPLAEFERWVPTMHTLEAGLRAGSGELEGALRARAPEPLPPTIVHGDYRLGNTLCAAGAVRMIIDWEIWSVGDPRVDLAWLVQFCEPGNFPGVGVPGCPMPPADELLAAYAERRRVPLHEIGWFIAVAKYKMAAVMGNNLARHRAGRHHDPFQDGLVPTIQAMIAAAGSHLDA